LRCSGVCSWKRSGQVAITANLGRKDEKCPGQFIAFIAICSSSLPAFDEKHVLAVVLPVAGGLPERLVEHERRLHLE
jgi:hypothetical protein